MNRFPDSPPDDRRPRPSSQNEPLPRAKLAQLTRTQEMIDLIQSAKLEDDIKDDEMLHRIYNPPSEVEELEPLSRLSMELFTDLTHGSQQMYANVKETLRRFDNRIILDSYFIVKSRMERLTGTFKVMNDMCTNGCIAYTGPFADLELCSVCNEPRYLEPTNPRKKKKARKQFTTIPLGPQVQAQWLSRDGAERMRYLTRTTAETLRNVDVNNNVFVNTYEDICHSSDYLEAVLEGRIREDDTVVMFSLDGAQLYRDKESDCWFFIWILLNLSLKIRYKKRYVLPGGFIPGPNKPGNLEPFLLPSFRHVSALQKEGLRAWDGSQCKWIRTHPFFLFGTADTKGLPVLSGLVGHSGKHGCRPVVYTPPRRHKPGVAMHYPAALQPQNHDHRSYFHPDVDINTVSQPNTNEYDKNLRIVLGAATATAYKERRLETGISRPSICLGLQATMTLAIPTCF
ncbi:hypothetical protein M378DRAFT_71096, partial [Amanita muscaria Koide BX008]